MSDVVLTIMGQIERRLEPLVAETIVSIDVDEIIQRMYSDCLTVKLLLKASPRAQGYDYHNIVELHS